MQSKSKVVVFFFRELNRHKEFSIISEVFFSVCLLLFQVGSLWHCQGAVYAHLGISLGGKCPFMPNFIGGQMSEGAYVLHMFCNTNLCF